jgi:hypothetical protein
MGIGGILGVTPLTLPGEFTPWSALGPSPRFSLVTGPGQKVSVTDLFTVEEADHALRADGAITSFRVKAPHKSRWAFIVGLFAWGFYNCLGAVWG